LKGDQHADREAFVLHHQQRPHHQNRQRHDLFERVGNDVVSVGQLPRGETGSEIAGKKLAVALFEHRLHLQGFNGFHPSHIFGEEGLVSGAQQKLVVELLAESRGNGHADGGDQG
jgi:hypothetical protein